MKKLVSLIVAAYNCNSTILTCINSIREQSYTNLEIIVIDDGSVDDTGKTCDELCKEDNRIILIHKQNGGVSSARNEGLDHASGKYVMFVDGDDYLSRDYVKNMVYAAEKYKAELIISGYTIVQNQKMKPHIVQEYDLCGKKEVINQFGNLYRNYFLHVVWNKLFIREKIKERFVDDLSLGEDCLFVLSYLENIELIHVVNEYGYNYVIGNNGSLTNKYRSDAYDIAERIYLNVRKYVGNTSYNRDALDAVGYVFLEDVTKVVREICKSKKMPISEKLCLLKQLSQKNLINNILKEHYQLGKRQRILFFLLKKGAIKATYLFGKVW